MAEDITREDFETAVLKNLLEIQITLRALTEFQERLGEAFELLAEQLGKEFTINEETVN